MPFNDNGFDFVFYVEPDIEHTVGASALKAIKGFLRDNMQTKFSPIDPVAAKKTAEKMKRLIKGCTCKKPTFGYWKIRGMGA